MTGERPKAAVTQRGLKGRRPVRARGFCSRGEDFGRLARHVGMATRDIRNRAELVRRARRQELAVVVSEARNHERSTLLARLWLERTPPRAAPGTH